MNVSSLCSISSPPFGIVNIMGLGHSNSYEVLSLSLFQFALLWWYMMYSIFHMLICHLYISGGMSVKLFGWLVVFILLSFKRVFFVYWYNSPLSHMTFVNIFPVACLLIVLTVFHRKRIIISMKYRLSLVYIFR